MTQFTLMLESRQFIRWIAAGVGPGVGLRQILGSRAEARFAWLDWPLNAYCLRSCCRFSVRNG